PPHRLDLGGHRLQPVEAAGGQRHVRALARELLRESGADARRGAGDEDDVAIEGGHQRAMRSMPTTRSASGVSRRAKAIRSPGRRPSKSAAEAAMKGISIVSGINGRIGS